MVTLYTFGRAFGLPDPSPYVMKAEILLKMANVKYQVNTKGFRKAPKGKLPYIEENGQKIADSTLIRFYLEEHHGARFDHGLSKEERAIAWAFEKMCEDHLYWAMLDMRWMVDDNFNNGPAVFFKKVPPGLRGLVQKKIRSTFRKNLYAHGMGRHTRSEIERLAALDLEAIAHFMGNKKYFMGDQITGTDATILAFVAGALCTHFEGPIRTAAEMHPNLKGYRDRMMCEFFPEWAAHQQAPSANQEGLRANA